MQQSQQHPGQSPQVHNSPPNMRANMNGAMNGMNQQAQQAYMASMANMANMAGFNTGNMNGSTPPANGFNVQNAGSASSPRMNHPNQPQQMQPNPQIVQMEAKYRSQFPQLPPDQISKLVRSELQTIANHRNNAMNAAAGSGSPLQGMPVGPQQYAQLMRASMGKQQAEAAAAQQQQNRSSSTGSNPGGNGMGPNSSSK
jgi:chromatin modification-related protein VID21